MDEKVKNKDADPAHQTQADLDEGLDETFPASDAPSATQPGSDKGAEKEAQKPR